MDDNATAADPGRMREAAATAGCPTAAADYRHGQPGFRLLYAKGGSLIPVQTPQGVRSDCKLPGGETLDEWELWRRDHPAKP